MQEFVYIIKSKRGGFIENMTTEESNIMEDHFQYLKDLLEIDKKLIMAGPCLDGAFGIVVFQAESMEEACEIMYNDPSVKLGVMDAKLHPYKVSLSNF